MDFWKDLRDRVLGLIIKERLGGKGIVVTEELGSGYSTEEERQANVGKLLEAQNMAMRDLPPEDDVTHCNEGLRRIAEAMGCQDFKKNQLANDQIDFLASAKGWARDSGIRAFVHASRGGLAVAAKKYPTHGHVATIRPTPKLGFSGSWNKEVPFVANVGKKNVVLPVSEAFPVSLGEPEYFLWNEV